MDSHWSLQGMRILDACDQASTSTSNSDPIGHCTIQSDVVGSANEPNSVGHGSVSALLLFFFALGCLFSIVPIANSILNVGNNKDYTHWHKFGRYVLEGKPLYRDLKGAEPVYDRGGEPAYMYPPTAAVLFYAPLSILNPVAFVVVLSCLTAASWAYSAWAAIKLTAGKWTDRPFLCLILPGLAVAPYVWDVQLLGQTNMVLLALTLGAFLLVRRRRPLVASGLFATAVALKAFPLPAIAYFVVRRQWWAIAGTIFSIFALVWFFPALVRGFDRNTKELNEWASLMILDQSGERIAGRSSIGFTRRNQSLFSCSHRLLRHIDAGDNPDKPLYVNLANVSPMAAQCVGFGICLALGMVLLMACRFRFAPSPMCEGLEVAMVCTLVPLCSPLAWTYFFCWLLPAWTAIGFWLENSSLPPRVRQVVTYGTVIGGLLIASAVTEQIDPTLQAYGVTAFGSVMLFLTLAYIRFNLPNLDPSDAICVVA